MLYKLLIVFFISLSSWSWEPVTTKINHKAWKKDTKLLIFKRRLTSRQLNTKKYQQITIKNKKKILGYLGASDWTITERVLEKDKFFIQGHYKDSAGQKVYFLEGHYLTQKEIKLFLLTSTNKKINKLEKNKNELERFLSEYL